MIVETQATPVCAGEHVVHFYECDDELSHRVAEFLGEAVESGGVGIAIVTEEHRRALRSELPERPALVVLDAAETLARFMSGGQIDRAAGRAVIGAILREAAASGGPTRVYGEMVAVLWERGDVVGALALEELWNELAHDHDFSLLCGYSSSSVGGPHHAQALEQVCRLHTSVSSSTREVVREFPAHADAPHDVRQLAAETLGRWGHATTLVDDAQLVLSELATNAILHARSSFSVVIRSAGSGVRLAVRDASRTEPTVRNDPTNPTGRGLRLVAALSSSWGVDVTAEGKTVWAELQP